MTVWIVFDIYEVIGDLGYEEHRSVYGVYDSLEKAEEAGRAIGNYEIEEFVLQ